MKVPLSTAAAGPLVDFPVPMTTASPRFSRLKDGAGGDARPGQLRADQGATNAVEQQMFGALDDVAGDVVECEVSDPGGQPSGRSVRIGGGLL